MKTYHTTKNWVREFFQNLSESATRNDRKHLLKRIHSTTDIRDRSLHWVLGLMQKMQNKFPLADLNDRPLHY